MGAAKAGDDGQSPVSGFPDVALPLPPSTDPARDRMPATAEPRDVSDDLVPPDPVHRRAPR